MNGPDPFTRRKRSAPADSAATAERPRRSAISATMPGVITQGGESFLVMDCGEYPPGVLVESGSVGISGKGTTTL